MRERETQTRVVGGLRARLDSLRARAEFALAARLGMTLTRHESWTLTLYPWKGGEAAYVEMVTTRAEATAREAAWMAEYPNGRVVADYKESMRVRADFPANLVFRLLRAVGLMRFNEVAP